MEQNDCLEQQLATVCVCVCLLLLYTVFQKQEVWVCDIQKLTGQRHPVLRRQVFLL